MAGMEQSRALATMGNGSAESAPIVVARHFGGSSEGDVKVQVYGRLLAVPAEATTSLMGISRHLAQQLKLSGQAAMELVDNSGRAIKREQELAAALREGRHPLKASMTVSMLREIELKKSEVESKKEELAQFQWQVVVDETVAIAHQVTAVAASLQSVKDECQASIQQSRSEECMRAERLEEAITRESQQRELGLREVQEKLNKLFQAISEERSARDVGHHQLMSRLESVVAGVESDRSMRAQEHAEMTRLYDTVKHQVSVEQARNEEQWNWHMETANRLDARLQERTTADLQQQARLGELEASAERLRASMAAVETALGTTRRTMEELTTRRQEELSKAVHDEVLSREHHMTRFAKELESSWQGLEAKVTRSREEATTATANVVERVRVLEQRCATVEQDLTNHAAAQGEKLQAIAERSASVAATVDAIEVSVKSTDVVAHTTGVKVDELAERLQAVEKDCRAKVGADFWEPQMEALRRADQRFESKLSQLESDVMARLQAETSQRNGMKTQLQESMRSCLEKLAPSAGNVEVVSPARDEGALVTPRCTMVRQDGAATPAMAAPPALWGAPMPRMASAAARGSSPMHSRTVVVPGKPVPTFAMGGVANPRAPPGGFVGTLRNAQWPPQ